MRSKIHKTALCYLTLALIMVMIFTGNSNATWINILNENFTLNWMNWPWYIQGHQWIVLPTMGYRWGIVPNISHYPFEPLQCIWCAGLYGSQISDLEPFIDPYPPYLDTKAIWGPFSLQNATEAECYLWYWNDTQVYYDYLLWGACLNGNFNIIYEGGRDSGPNATWNWSNAVIDFSQVVNPASGDTVSLLGQTQVYICFLFHSNETYQTTWGGFLDDITLGYDDGLFDLAVDGTLIANPDSTEVITPVKGGSYRMGLLWIAYGMGETPMFNIECYVDSALFYTERRSAIASKEGISYTTYSQDLWSGEVGQHYVEWILDVDDEVEETYENNNDAVMNFEVATFDSMPYIQILRPTEGDTADEGFWIKWEAYDRESNARIYLYYDVDSIGYNGIAIPTGDPIYEETSPDSFWWNTSNFPDGSCYYVLGMIYDFNNPYVYDYSDYPLYIHHTSGIDEDNWITPLDFALKPNFPNPFNASTTITYSTPEKSRVELSVYDIAGRLVAKLAQGEVSAGSYTVNWQAEATSGVYFCKISLLGLDSGKTFQSLQKMLLIR